MDPSGIGNIDRANQSNIAKNNNQKYEPISYNQSQRNDQELCSSESSKAMSYQRNACLHSNNQQSANPSKENNFAKMSPEELSEYSQNQEYMQNLDNQTLQALLVNVDKFSDGDIAKLVFLDNITQAAFNSDKFDKNMLNTLLDKNLFNKLGDDKDSYLDNISQAAFKSDKFDENMFNTLLDKNILDKLGDDKDSYLYNISQAAAYNPDKINNENIKKLLDNTGNINGETQKNDYLYNISQAAIKVNNIDNDTIKNLLKNTENINGETQKDDYSYNISQAAFNSDKFDKNMLNTLLDKKLLDKLGDDKDSYLDNISQAAFKSDKFDENMFNTLLDKNILDKLGDDKDSYLYNISQAAAYNPDKINNENIKNLLDNTKNIKDETKKNDYLNNISQATAYNTKKINNETINKLLDNTENIKDERIKNSYLDYISQAAKDVNDIDNDTIKNLLDNTENIKDETIKNSYLDYISQAAAEHGKNLEDTTITMLLNNVKFVGIYKREDYLYNISQAAKDVNDIDNDTIKNLLDNTENINSKTQKNYYLYNISQAAFKSDKFDENMLNTLLDEDLPDKLGYDKNSYLYNISQIAAYNTNKINNETINKLLDNTKNIKDETQKNDYLYNISQAAKDVNDIDNDTIKNLLDNTENINSKTQKNYYLYNISQAAFKSDKFDENMFNTLLAKNILDKLGDNKDGYLENITEITAWKGTQLSKEAINTLFKNINNKSLTNPYLINVVKIAINSQQFTPERFKQLIPNIKKNCSNQYKLDIRKLISAIQDSNLSVENKQEIYNTLKTKIQDNNSIDTLDNQSFLLLCKVQQKLGVSDNELQSKIQDRVKTDKKFNIHPALNYLEPEKLKEISESDIVNRNKNIDAQQFELEYLMDLKISKDCYDLNKKNGQNTVINILVDNYKILAHKFNIKSDTDSKIDIPNIEYYHDGVYNLAVIALKQMAPNNRANFLNNLIQKLGGQKNDPTDNEITAKINKTLDDLRSLLNEDGSYNHDNLLKIQPVLRQYTMKSSNYDEEQTNLRMPRTTDRCKVFEENDTKYLGFEGTEQKVETKLDDKTAEKLFGEQNPNGHQIIGNCWLISQMKKIETDPELKLFIYSHFDAKLDENGQLESATITLRDDKKLKDGTNQITFDKDIIEEVSKIGAEEHLSPAMSCLALLSAIYRKQQITDENVDNLKQEHDTSEIPNKITKDYLTTLFNLPKDVNPILYALRVSNKSGNSYVDLLSLFCTINTDTTTDNIERINISIPHHSIAYYGNLHLNPQNSYSLFHFGNRPTQDNDISDIPYNQICTHLTYYFPNITKKIKVK